VREGRIGAVNGETLQTTQGPRGELQYAYRVGGSATFDNKCIQFVMSLENKGKLVEITALQGSGEAIAKSGV